MLLILYLYIILTKKTGNLSGLELIFLFVNCRLLFSDIHAEILHRKFA